MVVRKALQAFFKTALGPDDLVAYMTPHMSGGDISFSSSTDPMLAYLDANPVWGVADELPGAETDAIETRPSELLRSADAAAWLALRSRLREQKSIEALRGLVAYLDGLRESRKAVIAVTHGLAPVPREPDAHDRRGTTPDPRRRAARRSAPTARLGRRSIADGSAASARHCDDARLRGGRAPTASACSAT